MTPVKSILPLLALLAFVACGLCGCNTLADRRVLYSPLKVDGPYTRSLHEGTWADAGVKPVGTPVDDEPVR